MICLALSLVSRAAPLARPVDVCFAGTALTALYRPSTAYFEITRGSPLNTTLRLLDITLRADTVLEQDLGRLLLYQSDTAIQGTIPPHAHREDSPFVCTLLSTRTTYESNTSVHLRRFTIIVWSFAIHTRLASARRTEKQEKGRRRWHPVVTCVRSSGTCLLSFIFGLCRVCGVKCLGLYCRAWTRRAPRTRTCRA